MVKIAICGSRTPSSAALVGVGARTWICAISSPNSHRVTSTSWTSESRTIISDTNPGGVSLLRCVLCTMRVRPREPESSSRFSSAYSGSNRRMKPTWMSGRPALASNSTSRNDDALSIVSGFSQRTGLPASTHAMTCSSWANPGDAMTTASTSSSATRSRASSTARTPSNEAASSRARSVAGSDTATSRAPLIRLAIRSAWSAPIRPTPRMPTRSRSDVTPGSRRSVRSAAAGPACARGSRRRRVASSRGRRPR